MKKASVLPQDMTLVGDIEGDDDLVVVGRVEGAIQVDASLVIEATGVVRGGARARSVVVRGILVGDIHAEESIWVEDGARVVGDLVAPRVKVMEGARFRGRVRILSVERGDRVAARVAAPVTAASVSTAPVLAVSEEGRPSSISAALEPEPPTSPHARTVAPRRPPPARMPVFGRIAARPRHFAGE